MPFLTELYVAKKAKPPDDNQDAGGDGKETTAGGTDQKK